MSDRHEFEEYSGGYTAGCPPHWLRPLLSAYPTLTVDRCGYSNGSWATLSFETPDGQGQVKMERDTVNTVSIASRYGRGHVQTGVDTIACRNVVERDELVGDVLAKRLCGHESFVDALEALF